MLHNLSLALGQLDDRRFIKVLLLGSGAALALLALAYWGLDKALEQVDPAGWPHWLGWIWGHLQGWAAIPLMLLLSYFLFPALATAAMGALLDDVVDAVEDRHYPAGRAARPMGLAEGAWLGLLSGLRMLLWNLAALPLYLLLLFTAIGPLALFLALNGYLLGRDYTQMAAIRHLPKGGWSGYLARNRGMAWAVGLITTAFFMVPGLNLLAPLVGAALATHAVQRSLGGVAV